MPNTNPFLDRGFNDLRLPNNQFVAHRTQFAYSRTTAYARAYEAAARDARQRQDSKLVLAQQKERLEAARAYNVGAKTLVLCSGVDSYGHYDPEWSRQFTEKGKSLARKLGKRLFGRKDIVVIEDATKQHLGEAVGDRGVRSIYLLGHASFSAWAATDGKVNWADAGRMVRDHLKNGVFANLGCGEIDPVDPTPLGTFVIGGQGELIGKRGTITVISEMDQLEAYTQLPVPKTTL